MFTAILHETTDQANNQPRPDITKFVRAIALVLAKTLKEIRHLEKAGDLTCSHLLSLPFLMKSHSKGSYQYHIQK